MIIQIESSLKKANIDITEEINSSKVSLGSPKAYQGTP